MCYLRIPPNSKSQYCIIRSTLRFLIDPQATIESGKTEFEVRDLTAKFTTDVIGTCAFGLECNSLKDSQSEFRRMGCAVLNSSASLALAKMIRVFFPKLYKALKLRTFPAEVQQFFMGIVKQTIDFRNTNQVRRNDFIQLLLEIKNQNHNQKNGIDSIELTEELIAAQVNTCFVCNTKPTVRFLISRYNNSSKILNIHRHNFFFI